MSQAPVDLGQGLDQVTSTEQLYDLSRVTGVDQSDPDKATMEQEPSTTSEQSADGTMSKQSTFNDKEWNTDQRHVLNNSLESAPANVTSS